MNTLSTLAGLIAIIALGASAEATALEGGPIAHAANVSCMIAPEGILVGDYSPQKDSVLMVDNGVFETSHNIPVYRKWESYGCGWAATFSRAVYFHVERHVCVIVKREILGANVARNGDTVCRGSTKVFQYQNGRESAVWRAGGLYALQVDVSPQLPAGRIFGTEHKSICGLGQANGEQRKDYRKHGNNRPIILASREARTGGIQFKPNDPTDEHAAFFVKGLIGLVVLALAYAILKRI